MIQSVNKYHIYEIFASDGKFYYSIPKYQREYTWSYREWDALYDDISENNPEYFINSSVISLMAYQGVSESCNVLHSSITLPTLRATLFLVVRERYENRRKNGHHRFLLRVTAKRKSARSGRFNYRM